MPATGIDSTKPDSGELLLLSGRDLHALLKPALVIEALQQTYEQLAANRADQGSRSPSSSKAALPT